MNPADDGSQPHDPADWRGYFGSLLAEGAITAEQEAELQRFFHDLQMQGQAEMLDISTEYNTRRSRDGRADADTWLQIQAMAMGKRHREAIERMLTGMGAPIPERSAAADADVTEQGAASAEDNGEVGDSGREWLRTEHGERDDKRPTRRLRTPQRR